ncbi:TVP38/TMEM64 family protein [Halanaerobacter jeridensis]|uniref:TVP38/TMEM64 family membrane protein n=1 Tax=Halanaerobacter jeridensis TaxID=706427 RepID=A0A938XTV3_9FIRM|nr:TVP38/TMEM64 family protein [Halanaerobacter jeridensis]MBM7557433.1 putative membrane protein YdjX (TVP38/TMEM64 family) [Halanaerobacter jeridensis]
MINRTKVFMTTIIIAIIVALIRYFDLIYYIELDNITELPQLIDKFGLWAPIIYILLYTLFCLFFLPRFPITLLGGVVFGPVWGTIWVSLAATVGATVSFLVSRYLAAGLIKRKFGASKHFKKIQQGVEKHNWRMLVITRMIPVFPFNLQNYLYGLTNIKLLTYIVVSWVSMLPATIAYCFAAGSIVEGTTSIKSTLFYLGVAAVVFVLLSLLPKFMKEKVFIDKD